MYENNIKRVVEFLIVNGWKYDSKDEYMHFNKNDLVSIDVGETEVVFIDDTGDFAHIPLNFYAVVGFIYVHRIIVPVIPESFLARNDM
jgi:hypothetical protein